MARPRSPQRSKAQKMYLRSGKTLKNKVIAERLGVSPSLVAKWKCVDGWGKPPLTEKPLTKGKRGAPFGNQNAIGNAGGGAPLCNQNARKHGAYSWICGVRIYRRLIRKDGRVLYRLENGFMCCR